jgi:hypothetical protein
MYSIFLIVVLFFRLGEHTLQAAADAGLHGRRVPAQAHQPIIIAWQLKMQR